MKQLRLFRKTIAFGYLLIAVLIGSIAYTGFYEWRRHCLHLLSCFTDVIITP